MEQNTDVADLCGENIGVKVRKRKRTKNSLTLSYGINIPPAKEINIDSEDDSDMKIKQYYLRKLLEELNQVIIIKNITNELNNDELPHINVLNAVSLGLNKAIKTISSVPIEVFQGPEIEEKRKKLLINIIPTEEERQVSEFEILATSCIRKIGMTPNYKLKHAMFKKMLLRLITSFYDERSKDIANKVEFGTFVYTSLMKKYMMKKAAQNRFKHLLSSCMKYKSINRVRVFGRFLGLYDYFDLNDLSIYLTNSQILKSSIPGKTISNQESSERNFTTYSRCMECIKLASKAIPKNVISEITHKLDAIKINDAVSKIFIVEIDEFLEILVEKYHLFKNETFAFLKEIYEAGDVRDM